jgi:hypothetical protein
MKSRSIQKNAEVGLALHVSFSAEAGAPQSKIAFERDSNVWITNIDGTRARQLIMGDDPRIAPDGTKVAFTMTPPGSKDVERYIAPSVSAEAR